jgi:hypothetical protein
LLVFVLFLVYQMSLMFSWGKFSLNLHFIKMRNNNNYTATWIFKMKTNANVCFKHRSRSLFLFVIMQRTFYLRIERIFFIILLACKSIYRSTFCMKRDIASYQVEMFSWGKFSLNLHFIKMRNNNNYTATWICKMKTNANVCFKHRSRSFSMI